MRKRDDYSLRGAWSRARAAMIALLTCGVMLMLMAWVLSREIQQIADPGADGALWSLARLDTEYAKLMRVAAAPPEDAKSWSDDVQTRFDIVYSVEEMLEHGKAFQFLRQNPTYDQALARLHDKIHALADRIDAMGPDLPPSARRGLLADLVAIGPELHSTLTSGRDELTSLGDSNRGKLRLSGIIMGTTLCLMLIGMALFALALIRLARDAEHHNLLQRNSAQRMHTIIDTTRDAVVVTDEMGLITEFNDSAERMFGIRRAQAVGVPAPELLFPPEEARKLYRAGQRFGKDGMPFQPTERQFEITALDRTGRHFPTEISFTRATNDNLEDGSQVAYFVMFIHDISRRRAAEEVLTAARDRALAGQRAKSEFLAMMSHEMRTPLNGLMGTLQLLQKEQLTHWQEALLERMQVSGRLLLGLVNDVLDLEKFEAGKMQAEIKPFSISKLIEGVVDTTQPLAQANGNQLDWTWIGPRAETGRGDPRRLRQVMLNLVGNAVKFTRDGRVDVEVELLGLGHEVEFRVLDTGVGIAETDLERIFEDFETVDGSYARNSGGSGLGLSITRRLVKLMGGEMGAESEPGEGSLFWVRLPLAPRDSQHPVAPSEPQPPAVELPPLEILLIEDNEINRFVAREMLLAEGHAVTEAGNGLRGVEASEKRRYDVILMDISMPVMDGSEAARRIRNGDGLSTDTPIIAVTAHALPEEIKRFRAAGMQFCVNKPINREELLRALEQALGLSGETPEPAPKRHEPIKIEAMPLIDMEQLQLLRESLAPKVLQGLMARFLAETEDGIERLVALGPHSRESAALAHDLTGSCGTFGLAALREGLQFLETRLKQNVPVTQQRLEQLRGTWHQTRRALEETLEMIDE